MNEMFDEFDPTEHFLADLERIRETLLKQRAALEYAVERLSVFDPKAVKQIKEMMR